jgi:hypothetical protein
VQSQTHTKSGNEFSNRIQLSRTCGWSSINATLIGAFFDVPAAAGCLTLLAGDRIMD